MTIFECQNLTLIGSLTFKKTIDILFLVIKLHIIGIICEYNPFHNGHVYHIERIKSMYPDSLIILVLNGYFLERGEISILTKKDKTKIALDYKVDIVLELPVFFGVQSADNFASAAVEILNYFGVQKIIIGSESNNAEKLIEIAKIQLYNPSYDEEVKRYLKEGINYPSALAKALHSDFSFLPNDLLGISYAKAIIKNNYPIKLECIKRTNSYNDLSSEDNIVSASNIRTRIATGGAISKYVPVEVDKTVVLPDMKKYFHLLKCKILTDSHINEYLDVDEGIQYRLKKYITKTDNLEEFINFIKTKRYTYNKLNRMFIHILLGIKKDEVLELDYVRILGFNRQGKNYLNTIKEDLKISVKANKKSKLFYYETNASLIYDIICDTNTFLFENAQKPIIK